MGQQQILLIVLSVILVGIAVSVGLTMFQSYALTANQDAIVLDIMNIATMAYQHRMRPSIMGGGNGSFNNFNLLATMAENANAEYGFAFHSDYSVIEIWGESKSYPDAIITAFFDKDLNLLTDLSGITPQSVNGGTSAQAGFLKGGWD